MDQHLSTTTYFNDASIVDSSIEKPRQISKKILSFADSGHEQDLKDFFRKPYNYKSGAFATSDTEGLLIDSFSCLTAFNANTVWTNKTTGFLNFRATMVVRIQINAYPFQAGRYIMSYLPQYSSFDARISERNRHLTSITQHPNVQIGMRDTEAVLRIPYLSPFTHINLASSLYDWGTVFLHCYAPLKTGASGDTTVRYNIWIHLEDVDLVTPRAQSSFLASKRARVGLRKVSDRFGHPREAEQRAAGIGPISLTLGRVARITSALTDIPMLAPLCGPVSWASNILSGVASAFGWSRPLVENSVVRTSPNIHAYACNSNASDVCLPLSTMTDNCLRTMEGFAGTDIDETSINFIKTRFAFLSRSNWVETDTAGTNIFKYDLKPESFYNNVTDVTGLYTATSTHDLPIASLARLFTYYRGSIKVKIKFVKTQFHSGRLMIAYVPYAANSTLTISGTDYVHRAIIDIRDCTEAVFEFPYALGQLYKKCDEEYGSINIIVVTPLRSPETVANNIDFILEFAGCDDLEYSVPRWTNLMAYGGKQGAFSLSSPLEVRRLRRKRHNSCRKRWVRENPNYIYVHCQMDVEDTVDSTEDFKVDDSLIADETLGSGTIDADTLEAAEYAIGERVVSLMQIIKRFTRTFINPGDRTTSVVDSCQLYPYALGGQVFAAAGAFDVGRVSDMFSWIHSAYAYSRGSVRWRGYSYSTSSQIVYDTYLVTPNNTTSIAATAAFDSTLDSIGTPYGNATNIPYIHFGISQSYGFAVQVPPVSKTLHRLNHFQWQLADVSLTLPDVPNVRLNWLRNVSSSGTATVLPMRAAADDYQLGFFIGFAPWLRSIALT